MDNIRHKFSHSPEIGNESQATSMEAMNHGMTPGSTKYLDDIEAVVAIDRPHSECGPNEVWLMNISNYPCESRDGKVYPVIYKTIAQRWYSARVGNQAYNSKGEILKYSLPIFVSLQEYNEPRKKTLRAQKGNYVPRSL